MFRDVFLVGIFTMRRGCVSPNEVAYQQRFEEFPVFRIRFIVDCLLTRRRGKRQSPHWLVIQEWVLERHRGFAEIIPCAAMAVECNLRFFRKKQKEAARKMKA